MRKKNLIICGDCQKVGKTSVLGEVDEGGNFAISRHHSDYTIISSGQFSVICGTCGAVVFQRIPKGKLILK